MHELHAKLAAVEQRLSNIENLLAYLVSALADDRGDDEDTATATLDGDPGRPDRNPRETL